MGLHVLPKESTALLGLDHMKDGVQKHGFGGMRRVLKSLLEPADDLAHPFISRVVSLVLASAINHIIGSGFQ
jgi:hypothetical protein